jgi:hypothetical protein
MIEFFWKPAVQDPADSSHCLIIPNLRRYDSTNNEDDFTFVRWHCNALLSQRSSTIGQTAKSIRQV